MASADEALKKAKARPAAESLLANAPCVFVSFCSA